MSISAGKCIEFAVKPQHSATGKPQGFAVMGRAQPHDKFTVVKKDKQLLIFTDKGEAERVLSKMARPAVAA